ncbi:hypothetical protein FB451DRAFT_1535636 [Mycena latifolia]|nr:hypothetical protein FB451DRAFT_1535636 [Mycena latifolia]
MATMRTARYRASSPSLRTYMSCNSQASTDDSGVRAAGFSGWLKGAQRQCVPGVDARGTATRPRMVRRSPRSEHQRLGNAHPGLWRRRGAGARVSSFPLGAGTRGRDSDSAPSRRRRGRGDGRLHAYSGNIQRWPTPARRECADYLCDEPGAMNDAMRARQQEPQGAVLPETSWHTHRSARGVLCTTIERKLQERLSIFCAPLNQLAPAR